MPLLHLRLAWDWSAKLGLLLEADAAAAKQGRAEDVLLALNWRLSPRAQLRFGYRFVEGGANVDEVYNFAWIHYLAAGSWRSPFRVLLGILPRVAETLDAASGSSRFFWMKPSWNFLFKIGTLDTCDQKKY